MMRNPIKRKRRAHSIDGVERLPFPPVRDYPAPQRRSRVV